MQRSRVSLFVVINGDERERKGNIYGSLALSAQNAERVQQFMPPFSPKYTPPRTRSRNEKKKFIDSSEVVGEHQEDYKILRASKLIIDR
jgi:hypothetical protein